ncbi:MAG: membrane-bound lytic murein transglycosylase MltF [Thermodesulfobacteriota bacterium]
MINRKISKQSILFTTILLLSLSGVIILFFYDGNLLKSSKNMDRIKEQGKITMITDNNAVSYYIYRDAPMGFEYELAKEFANYLDVELEIVTPGWDSMFDSLNEGKGDFIASGLTITEGREKFILFSQPYMTIQQKFIHHNLKFGIKSFNQLAGKTIHVRVGTSYQERLEELKESGIDIDIQLLPNISTDEIIRMVSEKEIQFTIADSNIALLNRRYYPDIKIGMSIQEEESLGWAVKKEDQELCEQINLFFEKAEETGILGKIYEKYYGRIEIFDYFDLKKFHERITTRLPKYREMIIRESKKYGFDWRMIAAVVYQESHFNARAKSSTGVRGLMQVTKITAKQMGIENRLQPEQSLEAGIKYLDVQYKKFKEMDNNHQRLLFALASYNVGYGHIRDAQKIAEAKGLDKNKWTSLKQTLPLLSKRKYYKKTKHGYARGREPVKYIENILIYYDILKQKANA